MAIRATPWVNDCNCEDEIASLPKKLGLNRNQSLWFLSDANERFAVSIHDFLLIHGETAETINEAKLRVFTGMSEGKWDITKTGTFADRPALKYIATYSPKVGETMYALENGMVL